MSPRARTTISNHLLALLSFDAKLISKPSLLTLLKDNTFELPTTIIGIDEVGRGCLAGPVVAAAVQLPAIDSNSSLMQELSLLNDSKKLRAQEREILANVIMNISSYSIGEASVDEIDHFNILQASLLAMQRARLGLNTVSPALVIVDGNKTVPGIIDLQIAVVKGDALSASIAAASIIAKVHRDRLMQKLSLHHPNYHWQKNKGYGSKEHKQAIAEHGLSAWHRKTFNCSLKTKSQRGW